MPSTIPEAPRLLLIGCGKMGSALLESALAPGAISMAVCVVEPSPPSPRLKSTPGLAWVSSPDKIPPDFVPNLTVIAVKPQQMDAVLPAYARFKDSVFLSIAAGTTLARLEKLLGGANTAIVRAMPNLPASIGQGISALIANSKVSAAQRALCDAFMKNAGDVIWLESESLMDAVTALSASGPAYIFALCEKMAKAGEALGLPPEAAMRLARQTIIGSGALLAQSDESVETLRRNVTSPNGTTEAALKVLLAENGLEVLMTKAIAAAAQRAKELAQ